MAAPIRVYERPPVRLHLETVTPDGLHTRIGEDDPNPIYAPSALTFTTEMPGGFGHAQWTLERNPKLSYPDLKELSRVAILGVGGSVAWEGRIEKLPATGAYQSQVTPEAFGYSAALEDDAGAREIFVDRDLTHWEGASIARKIQTLGEALDEEDAAVGAGSVKEPSSTASPALVTQMTGPWAREHIAEGWYNAAGIPIASLYYAWTRGETITATGGNWVWHAFLAETEKAEGNTSTGNLQAAGPGSGTLASTTAKQVFALVQLANTAAGGENGKVYPVLWTVLAVYGRHGLELHGTNSQTEAKGVLASDAVAYAVGKWASEIGYTTGSEGTIRTSTFIVPQLAFPEPTTVAEMIKQATRFELPDWAVWEGPTFWMYPRPERDGMRAAGEKWRRWKARVGPSQLQEAGPQISRIVNGVVVQYTDVAGKTRYVGPPGFSGPEPGAESSLLEDTNPENPCNETGIKKWAKLTMGTCTQEGAKQVGAIFLREQRQLEQSGQAALVGYVEDEAGNWWPAWAVRAGDQISFTDAANPGWRNIVSTSYDDNTNTNTIQLEVPPETMNALLERLAVSVSGFGED